MNTITGCLNDCAYCYARDIANRFTDVYPFGFRPTFHPSRLGMPSHAKVDEKCASEDPSYRNVFLNSMSDTFGKWVPAEWIHATLDMAEASPEWNFLMLTKYPKRAAQFDFPDNVWMGATVDRQKRVASTEDAFEEMQCKTKWLSVEPLLEPLKFKRLDLFRWVVIGGESRSSSRPASVPRLDWLAAVHVAARLAGCGVYHKTNLHLPDQMRHRDFPWSRMAGGLCRLPTDERPAGSPGGRCDSQGDKSMAEDNPTMSRNGPSQ